jgi:hypothetical protein
MVTRKTAVSKKEVPRRARGPQRPGDLAESAFELAADEIVERYDVRGREPRGATPFAWPENQLKRECYNLIIKHTRWSGAEIIAIVRKYGCVPESITFRKNKFYWELLAIDPKITCISDPSLSKYSIEMLYAWRHRVPPEYLIGFLLQSGNLSSLRVKLREGRTEKDFVDFRKIAVRTSDGSSEGSNEIA